MGDIVCALRDRSAGKCTFYHGEFVDPIMPNGSMTGLWLSAHRTQAFKVIKQLCLLIYFTGKGNCVTLPSAYALHLYAFNNAKGKGFTFSSSPMSIF